MRVLGPEEEKSGELRKWFAEQQHKNLERLEDAARTITQLVTGLYGLLFALLALSSNPTPAYLRDELVRWLASFAMGALFLALLLTLATVYPRAIRFQEDNLSSMRDARVSLQRFKAWSLRLGLLSFLIGVACLAVMIGRILWTI